MPDLKLVDFNPPPLAGYRYFLLNSDTGLTGDIFELISDPFEVENDEI